MQPFCCMHSMGRHCNTTHSLPLHQKVAQLMVSAVCYGTLIQVLLMCLDPEARLIAGLYAEGHMARLFLVVDTNILLTHLAVLEHVREMVRQGSAPSKSDGNDRADGMDVIVVVPWIVLYELDRIKSERPDSQGASLSSMHLT